MNPACGFLLPDGTRCPNAAVVMARVETLGHLVPCCADCVAGMQAEFVPMGGE